MADRIDAEDIVATRRGSISIDSCKEYIKDKGYFYNCTCRCGVKFVRRRDHLLQSKNPKCKPCSDSRYKK